MKLEGQQTAGRFALWEAVLPHGAAPPLHSHPEDETFYVLDGELTAWLVEPGRHRGLPASPCRTRQVAMAPTAPGRVPAERIAAVERELGMVRHGPPPPS